MDDVLHRVLGRGVTLRKKLQDDVANLFGLSWSLLFWWGIVTIKVRLF